MKLPNNTTYISNLFESLMIYDGGWGGLLSGKAYVSEHGGIRFEPHLILWDFRLSVLRKKKSEPQPRTGETGNT